MSLSIQVELLTGRYVATRDNDYRLAEWPPHPARLFAAAVATWATAPATNEAVRERERDALRWLECLGPPAISCSVDDDVAVRKISTHFVPVNDVAGALRIDEGVYENLRVARTLENVGSVQAASAQEIAITATAKALGKRSKEALKLLPDARVRQARTFPSVTPADPRIVFTWPDADPSAEQRRTLDGLLARIGRLGHSSSLVSCRVVDAGPEPTLAPAARGEVMLRVPFPGQFDMLEEEFAWHRGLEPRSLPAEPCGYASVGPDRAQRPRSTWTADWLVLACDRSATQLGICDALAFARALRDALAEHADPAAIELIRGRDPVTSAPSTRPHLAVLPLPFVAHRFGDGVIRGVALALPVPSAPADEEMLLAAVRAWRAATDGRLELGGRPVLLRAEEAIEPSVTLRPATWCRASRTWATVTPIALDRFPGDLRARAPRHTEAEATARAIVARACTHIGLPEPAAVDVGFPGPLSAVPDARAFPPFRTPNGGPPRMLLHARLLFAEPVEGPVVLGAGRYVGQGLCMPCEEDGGA